MAKTNRVPFKPEDLRRIAFVSDPVVHPQGAKIAYVVHRVEPDGKKNRYRSEIRLTDPLGKSQRILTEKSIRADSPLWSPDGRWLLFLGKREEDKKSQVFLLPAGGGKARRLTRLENGASSPAWSPDGRQIAFLSPTDPAEMSPGKGSGDIPLADDVEVIERALWKLNGKGSLIRRRPHLFVIPARGGKPQQLTRGPWSVSGFAFARDGRRLFFIASPDPADDWASAVRGDLYVVNVTGSGRRRITDFPGQFQAVTQSATGEVYALGSDRELSWASPSRLWQIDLGTGRHEAILPGLDRGFEDRISCDVRFPSAPHDPWISEDGGRARFLMTDGPAVRLVEADLVSRSHRLLAEGDMSVLAWHTNAKGSVRAEIRSSMTQLPELWSVDDQGRERRITHLNDRLIESRKVFGPVPLAFKASDGEQVDAWLLQPSARGKSRSPIVLAIHGGPKTAYGHAFMLEFQILAGAGMAVLLSNPRGSDGYGTAWAHAVLGHYGERDYQDLMECVDHALEAVDGLDVERLGVSGGSYGGFMTNWIVGHTQRFKAAVSSRGISNWVSMYGTSDIGFFFNVEHVGGTPWGAPERYRDKSPLTYVENVTTPILLTHGEKDLRCPIEQAEQFFVALRRLGKTAALARFPEEDHELSRSGTPNRRMERLRLITSWFRRHL
jgi:dipeptidyl aminopeptidase/acylaminoacyl peptidase